MQQSNNSMETTNDINILGASGHGKVIVEIAELSGWQIAGIYDANNQITEFLGYSVHPQSALTNDNNTPIILAIGNNSTRKKIAETLNNCTFATLLHPQTSISKRASILHGTVVMPGASINAAANIGRHCIINTNASIDHDCYLEDYVHISPNVGLAGNVSIGEGTHIGIGAQVIQGIRIGKWATVGAGAVIIKDIPDYAVVVGNPGKIIKYNK